MRIIALHWLTAHHVRVPNITVRVRLYRANNENEIFGYKIYYAHLMKIIISFPRYPDKVFIIIHSYIYSLNILYILFLYLLLQKSSNVHIFYNHSRGMCRNCIVHVVLYASRLHYPSTLCFLF